MWEEGGLGLEKIVARSGNSCYAGSQSAVRSFPLFGPANPVDWRRPSSAPYPMPTPCSRPKRSLGDAGVTVGLKAETRALRCGARSMGMDICALQLWRVHSTECYTQHVCSSPALAPAMLQQ